MIKLSNKVYDTLKFLVTIGFPASAACYCGLAKIYGWPYASEVAQTSAVICTFIGTLIGISSVNYWNAQQNADTQQSDEASEVH